jgi:O-antigen/teichoic acid export membrane protein
VKNSVARGTLLGVAGQGWHLVTALALYAYLSRVFAPGLFGKWLVVLSVLGWFEIFITAGLVRVATKAISEAPDDEPQLARAVYLGQVIAGVSVFLIVQLIAGPVARLLSDASFAPLIRLAALDIPLYAAFMAASSVVLGARRFERQAVAWFIYATSKAVFIAGAVVFGFSITGALVGNAASSAVGLAVVYVASPARRTTFAEVGRVLRSMVRPSAPFLTFSLVEGIELSVSLWLVSAIVANSVLVALYASAAALAEIPVFLFLGLNRVIFPSVARARAAGDTRLASDYARQAVRLALIVTVMGIAIVSAMGRQILVLIYSSPYAGAFVPLVLLILAGAGRTVRAVCTEVLLAEDRRRRALSVLATTTALEIALVSVLAAKFGLVGAASGAAASAVAAAIWASVLIRDLIGWRPLATLARCAGAGVVVGLGLAALSPAPALVPVMLPITGILYGVILAVLGEFSPDDIASLRTVVWRRERA